MNLKEADKKWLKDRGYLHITPKLDVKKHAREIYNKVTNECFVEKHSFFPLIHCYIKERRYKRITPEEPKRAHSYKKGDTTKRNVKLRPLHYATHIDAFIYGYYASMLQEAYDTKLSKSPELSSCITAYRKIPKDDRDSSKGKGTVEFASEAFIEIERRASMNECVVLKFDIKSFFSSLDHKHLKKAWYEILDLPTLPKHHYNVFKAVTRFSYILLDDLRVKKPSNGRKYGFNERKLATLRKNGIHSFFESTDDFHEHIKDKKLKVFKNPFRKNNDKKTLIGIPQGLPISAVLANIYLYDFDRLILEEVVRKYEAYYRRYSDDIIVVCDKSNYAKIKEFIFASIKRYEIEISEDKTETFFFKKVTDSQEKIRIKSFKETSKGEKAGVPFVYLGLEYYGYQTLIKSASIAKFYRRMITTVKKKARRAKKAGEKKLSNHIPPHKRRLYKLFSVHGKKGHYTYPKRNIWRLNHLGEYVLLKADRKRPVKSRGNYISYVNRVSERVGEAKIKRQVRNHFRILKSAIKKHFNLSKSNNQQNIQ